MSDLHIDRHVNRPAKGDDDSAAILILPTVRDYTLGRLFGMIAQTRGIARVELSWSGWEDSELWREAPRVEGGTVAEDLRSVNAYVEDTRQWRRVLVYGTRTAVRTARFLAADVASQGPNADHDHASCVARAAEMGVPAAYAHTPETYLSA